MDASETWTPLFDALVDRLGLLSAVVYGVVWRYCRMRDGVCKASLDTLAARAGLSKWTVYRHLATLEKEGFIRDLSPDLRNSPHVYQCTNRLESLKYEEVAQSQSGLSQSQSSEVGAAQSQSSEGVGAAQSQPALSQSNPSEGIGVAQNQRALSQSQSSELGIAQYQPGLVLSQPALSQSDSSGGVGVAHSQPALSQSQSSEVEGVAQSQCGLSQSQPALSQSDSSEEVGVAQSQCVLSQSQRGGSTVTMPGVAQSQLSKTLLRDSLRDTVKIRGSPEEIWQELLGQFQASRVERSTWLECAVPLSFDPETRILTLGTYNPLGTAWILDHQPKTPIVIRCTTIY